MWNQYAFVHFGSYGEAEKALNGIKGIQYKGCKISVQWSTSPKYQQPKQHQSKLVVIQQQQTFNPTPTNTIANTNTTAITTPKILERPVNTTTTTTALPATNTTITQINLQKPKTNNDSNNITNVPVTLNNPNSATIEQQLPKPNINTGVNAIKQHQNNAWNTNNNSTATTTTQSWASIMNNSNPILDNNNNSKGLSLPTPPTVVNTAATTSQPVGQFKISFSEIVRSSSSSVNSANTPATITTTNNATSATVPVSTQPTTITAAVTAAVPVATTKPIVIAQNTTKTVTSSIVRSNNNQTMQKECLNSNEALNVAQNASTKLAQSVSPTNKTSNIKQTEPINKIVVATEPVPILLNTNQTSLIDTDSIINVLDLNLNDPTILIKQQQQPSVVMSNAVPSIPNLLLASTSHNNNSNNDVLIDQLLVNNNTNNVNMIAMTNNNNNNVSQITLTKTTPPLVNTNPGPIGSLVNSIGIVGPRTNNSINSGLISKNNNNNHIQQQIIQQPQRLQPTQAFQQNNSFQNDLFNQYAAAAAVVNTNQINPIGFLNNTPVSMLDTFSQQQQQQQRNLLISQNQFQNQTNGPLIGMNNSNNNMSQQVPNFNSLNSQQRTNLALNNNRLQQSNPGQPSNYSNGQQPGVGLVQHHLHNGNNNNLDQNNFVPQSLSNNSLHQMNNANNPNLSYMNPSALHLQQQQQQHLNNHLGQYNNNKSSNNNGISFNNDHQLYNTMSSVTNNGNNNIGARPSSINNGNVPSTLLNPHLNLFNNNKNNGSIDLNQSQGFENQQYNSELGNRI
jgi:hypothetical protein